MTNGSEGPDVPSLDAVKPIEDAGTLHAGLMITFLLACLYFCITVTSTTHRLLLLGASLKLPILDVSIPLEGFYVIAPGIIFGAHIYLLLQYHVLIRRLGERWVRILKEDADFFLFPAIPVLRHVFRKEEPFVSLLIRAGLILINVVVPILALCLAQYYFLPYHSVWITLWHQILIFFDLFIIWYFFIIVRFRQFRTRILARRNIVISTGTFLVLFFSWVLAVVPGTCFEYFRDQPLDLLPAWVGFERNLRLSDQLLINEEPSQEVIAAFANRNVDSSNESIYLRFAIGARLQGRNLQYANLEQAKLFNADLRGADLRKAKLVGADLRGANLNPQEYITLLHQSRGILKREAITHVLEHEEFKPTNLDEANLTGANFKGAQLVMASMRHTNLRGAILERLELTGANFSHANLSGARLSGSDLTYARLDGATLQNAHLEGALLDHASLRGAILTDAEALGASFLNSNLEGAQLTGANLSAATFLDANLIGTDLRSTYLHGAVGLRLDKSDLRGAHLGGTCNTIFKTLSDLRSIDFIFPDAVSWGAWRQKVEFYVDGLPSSESAPVLGRFDNATQRTRSPKATELQAGCIGTPFSMPALNRPALIQNFRLLYSNEQLHDAMAYWPPLKDQNQGFEWNENSFNESLATELLKEICNSPGLARTLVLRAAGEYEPGDEVFDIEVAKQITPILGRLPNCTSVREFILERQKEHPGLDLARQIAWRLHKSGSASRSANPFGAERRW
jgi:uncharacterized protein YjbI with pentapeptide repeats